MDDLKEAFSAVGLTLDRIEELTRPITVEDGQGTPTEVADVFHDSRFAPFEVHKLEEHLAAQGKHLVLAEEQPVG
jgi:hypothetical protein